MKTKSIIFISLLIAGVMYFVGYAAGVGYEEPVPVERPIVLSQPADISLDALNDYEVFTARAFYCSADSVCVCAPGELPDGAFVEINDVGVYLVRESDHVAPGEIHIHFNSAEDAENFDTKQVKVRVCDEL